MQLEVIHVSKKYEDFTALKDVHFSLNRGEITGFLGPNGAGKSTLMKIITGVITDFEGDVRVNGISVRKDPVKVKKMIGYLPEHNPLYPELYVREYLSFLKDVHKVALQRVEEVIEQTGLSSHAGKRIRELSKGYRQRVGLAAALIHDPEILILDEPTTGLDPNQLVEIRNLIMELSKEKSILFSTHILPEAEIISDRIIIIHQGKILADQSPESGFSDRNIHIRVAWEPTPGENALSSLPGLIRYELNSGYAYLTIDQEVYTPTLIYEWSVEKSFKIKELIPQKNDLTGLFRQLTSQSPK